MANLETIGAKSKIYSDDEKWLNALADELDDQGLYTTAIYLRQMLDNALITLPVPPNCPNEAHNHLRRG